MCDVLLHVRCGGCAKMYRRQVSLPDNRPMPVDGDELMESPEIRDMRFQCPKCEAPFAEIVAFKVSASVRAA